MERTGLRAERARARSRGTGWLACAGRVRPRRRHPSLEDRALQPDLPHPREGRPPVLRRAQNLHAHAWTPAEIEVLEKPRVLGVTPVVRVLKPEEFVEGGEREVPRIPGFHPDVSARRNLRLCPSCSTGRHDGRGYAIAPKPGFARPYGERGARREPRESREYGAPLYRCDGGLAAHEIPPPNRTPAARVKFRPLHSTPPANPAREHCPANPTTDPASRSPLPPPPATGNVHRPFGTRRPGGRPV